MPLLNAIHNKYEPLGFTVLGVNVEEKVANARSFIDERPVDFPILLDNRDGNMRFLHQGYQSGDEAEYHKMVKKLVRE